MDPKCIWIINQAAGSKYHGMVFRSYYIGAELVKQGHEVHLFAASFSHTLRKLPDVKGKFTHEDIDGINYHWVKTSKYPQSKSFGRVWSMFEFLFKLVTFPISTLRKPDAIIVSSPPPLAVLIGLIWAKMLGAKIYFEVRDIWPLSVQVLGKYSRYNPFIIFLKLVEITAYRFSTGVLAVLSGAEDYFRSQGVNPDKVYFLPNGIEADIDSTVIPSSTADAIALIGKNNFVIGYAGSLGLANDMLKFVKVANALKKDPRYQFVIVGSGPQVNEIQALAKTYGLNNFHYFPPVPKVEIPSILKHFNLGYVAGRDIELYQHGISPNKLFDYMLAKVPVLMVINSKSSIIQEADCGINLRNFRPDFIAQEIAGFFALSKERREVMGLNGYKYVLEHHEYSKLSKRLIDIVDGKFVSVRKPRVAFLVVEDKAFLIQRLNLALFIKSKVHEVHVISNKSELSSDIEKLGFIYHDSHTKRRSMNPFRELASIYHLYKLFKEIKPDIAHHISIKSVIYGTLAARLAGVPKVINLVNGLGFVFNDGGGWKRRILRAIVNSLYRLVLTSKKVEIIFQNPDDQQYFESKGYVKKSHSHLILGSGVDVDKFSFHDLPTGRMKFIFVSRMLWEKGVDHLILATSQLKAENLDFEVWFVGEPDPLNPSSVKLDYLENCEEQGLIKYLGFRKDIVSLLHQTHVSILPTFYREGVPLSLIEAASTGNAIITTDMPGCREIVKDGVNGFLVPPKDEVALANAMRKLILNPELVQKMGLAGRERVVEMFSKEIVNERSYEVYLK